MVSITPPAAVIPSNCHAEARHKRTDIERIGM